jgi:homeobox protein cut-like
MSLESLNKTVSFWQNFDLPGKRTLLDAVAVEIANKRDASTTSREELLEFVRSFRSLSDDEKVAGIESFVQKFTKEVDSLSKRARFAEKHFLGVFKDIVEMDDPVPVVNDAISEVTKLKAEVDALETELSQVENQDITIREMERRIMAFEDMIDSLVAEQVAAREQEMRTVFEAELESVRENETAAEARIRALQASLDEMTSASLSKDNSFQSSQTQAETETIKALSDENARLSAQLQSSLESISTLQRRLDASLPLESVSNAIASTEVARKQAASAEEELASAVATISKMRDEALLWENVLMQQKHEFEREISSASKKILEKDEVISKLHLELDSRPSLEERDILKKQLMQLQEVIYASTPVDSNNSANVPHVDDPSPSEQQLDVHSLMLRRIRALEAKLVTAESVQEEQISIINDLRTKLSETQQIVVEKSSLASKLEEDLLSLRSTMPSILPNQPSKDMAAVASSDNGLLEVVQNQRDRFRSRLVELEDTLANQQVETREAKLLASKLQVDNEKLFEKIRYLQSIVATSGDTEAGAAAASSSGLRSRSVVGNNGASAYSISGEDDFEGSYRKAFMESIDPFAEFKRKEKAKQIDALSPADKLTLKSSAFVLANQHTRLFVFVYVILLHFVMLATVFHFAGTSHKCLDDHDHHGGVITDVAPGIERFIPKSIRGN